MRWPKWATESGPPPSPVLPGRPRALQFADGLVLASAAFCAVIAGLSLVAATLAAVPATSPGAPPIVMAPPTAAVFLMFSCSMVMSRPNATFRFVPKPWVPRLAFLLPAAVALGGVALYIAPAVGVNVGSASGSGLTFGLLGAALVLRTNNRRILRAASFVIVLFWLALLFVIVLWLAYVSSSTAPLPGLSGIALLSIVTFVALLFGMLMLEVPSGYMHVLAEDSPAGDVARRMLPATFVLPPVLGYLRLEGEFAHLYDTPVGTTLFASSLVGVFAIVAALSARAVRRLEVGRRQAEEGRRRSEAWFATAFRASPVAFTLSEVKSGTFIDLNPAAETLLGVSKAEAVGKTSIELGVITAETRAKSVAQVEREGRARAIEFPIMPKGGPPKTALVSIEALDYGGRTVLLTVLVDITERKRAEQEVLRSRQTLAEAQRIGHVGSWEWDVSKDRAVWSDELYRIFGLDPSEPAANYARALTMIHPEDQATFAGDVQKAIEGPAPYYSEYRIIRADGETRFLTSQGEVTRDGAGKAVWMVGAVHDLTERKRNEEAMLQSREELVAKADELARSNSELEQFAYVASHDLQEPLRMVASYVQLIRRRYQGKLDSDADEFIQYAVEGSNRMQALINDLLTYSRVGTRGKPLVLVDAQAALARAIENLQVTIDESKAVIKFGKMPRVKADEMQLVQLFQNLLSNAVKYRASAPPQVEVTAARDGDAWHFQVKDNGIGIDPKHFDRIFIIFQRLQARDETSGTGIGLALCKKIVERHGGRIWVESAPGKGSTFHFTIPDKGKGGGTTL
jgi:PAS domain S-box-containing protein